MRPIILANHKNSTPGELAAGIPGSKVVVPYRQKIKDKNVVLINWGTRPKVQDLLGIKGALLNNPTAVNIAINKRLTFKTLDEAKVPCVEWSEDLVEAQDWLNRGKSVFGRLKLEASEGAGIVLCVAREYKFNEKKVPEAFKACKIWTKNYPKDREARVHVFQGKVIHYSEKRRVSSERLQTGSTFNRLAKPDFWVRSHRNGWIFATSDVVMHEKACHISVAALRAIGLDFGAVDVLINGKDAVVCEVNTAPGLEGKTLSAYLDAFNTYLKTRGRS